MNAVSYLSVIYVLRQFDKPKLCSSDMSNPQYLTANYVSTSSAPKCGNSRSHRDTKKKPKLSPEELLTAIAVIR